jgi:hypothetical protein
MLLLKVYLANNNYNYQIGLVTTNFFSFVHLVPFPKWRKSFQKTFQFKIPLDAAMALVVEGEKSLPQLRTTTTVTGTSFWRVTRARKSIAMTILNGKVL